MTTTRAADTRRRVDRRQPPAFRKPSRKGIDWNLAKSWYVTGWDENLQDGSTRRHYPTYKELAEKLGIHLRTVEQRALQDGWVDTKEKHAQRLEAELQAAEVQALVDARLRIRKTALDGAEKLLTKVVKALDAIPEGGELAASKALPGLALAQRTAQQTAHVATGLPKDGTMPMPGSGGGGAGQSVTLWARLRTARGSIGVAVQVQQGEGVDDGAELEAEPLP